MAVTITWADVTPIAPELSTAPMALQTAVLADVALEVNVTAFGSQARALAAAKYLAAHLATLSINSRGGSPALQSISIGGVSKSFAVSVAAGNSALESTNYGKEYRRRLRQAAAARLPGPI